MRVSAGRTDALTLARETSWFADLENADGFAAALSAPLRLVLLTTLVDVAEEQSRRAHATAEEQDREQRQDARRREAERKAKEQELREQRERERRRSEAECEVAARAANEARRERWESVDVVLIVGWFWACVLLLVPWLIGYFVLKDGPLLPRNAEVYDVDARDDLDYFWSYYFAGVGALSLLVSAVLLLRSWRRRVLMVIVGIALLLGAVIGAFPWSRTLWTNAEAATAAVLTTTSYPFGSEYYTCGSGGTVVTDSNGLTSRWQVHTARIVGTVSSDCNRLVVYQGWTEVGEVDLDEGRYVNDGPVPNDGTTTADTVFTIETTDGGSMQLDLAEFDSDGE